MSQRWPRRFWLQFAVNTPPRPPQCHAPRVTKPRPRHLATPTRCTNLRASTCHWLRRDETSAGPGGGWNRYDSHGRYRCAPRECLCCTKKQWRHWVGGGGPPRVTLSRGVTPERKNILLVNLRRILYCTNEVGQWILSVFTLVKFLFVYLSVYLFGCLFIRFFYSIITMLLVK